MEEQKAEPFPSAVRLPVLGLLLHLPVLRIELRAWGAGGGPQSRGSRAALTVGHPAVWQRGLVHVALLWGPGLLILCPHGHWGRGGAIVRLGSSGVTREPGGEEGREGAISRGLVWDPHPPWQDEQVFFFFFY